MSYTLHLRIVEADDLAKMDTIGLSDPYCLVQLGTNTRAQKTKVKENTLKPVWNEEFHWPITDQDAVLHILMKDQDPTNDDPMAKLEININTLNVGQVVDRWFDMRPLPGCPKGGKIRLILHKAPNGAPAFKQSVPQQQQMYQTPQQQPQMYQQQQMMMQQPTMMVQQPVMVQQQPMMVQQPVVMTRPVMVGQPVVMGQTVMVQQPVMMQQQPMMVQQPPMMMQQPPMMMQQPQMMAQQQPMMMQQQPMYRGY